MTHKWISGLLMAALQLQPFLSQPSTANPANASPMHASLPAASADWTFNINNQGVGRNIITADINGDGFSDAIVGANEYSNYRGAVYGFYGSANGLNATPDWSLEGENSYDSFGAALANAGDVNGDGYADLLVGAGNYPGGTTYTGKVYLYYGSASGPEHSPAWEKTGEDEGSRLGSALSGVGDLNADGFGDVIIGAPGYGGSLWHGRAYTYLGSADGLPANASQVLTGTAQNEMVGNIVARAGDVNADGFADVVLSTSSQAYTRKTLLYQGGPDGLDETPAWTITNEQAGYMTPSGAGDLNGDGYADIAVVAETSAQVYFGAAGGPPTSPGWTVAIANNHCQIPGGNGDVNGDGYADLAISDRCYTQGETYEGTVALYLGSSGGLASTAAWTAEGNHTHMQMGASINISGDINGDGYSDILTGAYDFNFSTTPVLQEGKIFAFHGAPDFLAAQADWSVGGGQTSAHLGQSVSQAGDVNGDGFDDVLIAAPTFDNEQADEGRVYLYAGSASGLNAAPAWSGEGNQPGAQYGSAVNAAGDVNGDGFADVAIGAPYFDHGQDDEGVAVVYAGSATGLQSSPLWSVEGDQAASHLGSSLASAGDVNGDGFADLVVGAPGYNNVGQARLYLGAETGLSAVPTWTANGVQTGEAFGSSVGSAGDVNGDGFADVLIGAAQASNGENTEGKALLYLGSAAGLSATPAWTVEGNLAGAGCGAAVGSAGDVNGDGFADLLIGCPGYSNEQTNEGRVYIYSGSSGGPGSLSFNTIEINQENACFGISVSTAGDVNGDGLSEIVIGAHRFSSGQTNEGAAFLYRAQGSPVWGLASDQDNAFQGVSVSSAGDVNGDGYNDVIIGASGYTAGQSEEGRATVYYGNARPGLPLALRMYQPDRTPLPLYGVSTSPDSLQLSFLGRSPWGRSKARLEWEIKPAGVPLDAAGLESTPTFVDTGLNEYLFEPLLSGLSKNTAYHWRVRLWYDPITTPGQPHSRWFSPPQNGWAQPDFRTADLPIELEFDQAAYTSTESSGAVTIRVQISKPPEQDVHIQYHTEDGSALAGNDYAAASGTLTFVAGATASQAISIQIIRDFEHETDETFTLVLSGITPSGAARVAGTNPVQITLTDSPQTIYLPFNLR